MESVLVNVGQAARRLGVARSTLWRIRTKDASFPEPLRLPSGARRFRLADLDAWIAALGKVAGSGE